MYNDIIRDPGKFEGEQQWVEDYYNATLDGSQDETIYDHMDRPNDVFKLHPSDLYYTELTKEGYEYVVIWTDNQGFVYGVGLTQEGYDEMVMDLAQSVED